MITMMIVELVYFTLYNAYLGCSRLAGCVHSSVNINKPCE